MQGGARLHAPPPPQKSLIQNTRSPLTKKIPTQPLFPFSQGKGSQLLQHFPWSTLYFIPNI